MECEENGAVVTAVAGHSGLKRKRGGGGARCVQLARAPALPCSPGRRPPQVLAQSPRATATPHTLPPSPFCHSPFLHVNLMEEITFWVCTRRAPCLYGYNNVFKKKIEEAHCSKYINSSEPSFVDEVPSPKKKRRLRLLDDESVSSEKQQNVYFERSHKRYCSRRSWYSSDKSASNRSDVDFNIRNGSIRNKSKLYKSQKKNRNTPNKKHKITTSTPKPTVLRRSLRKTQQNVPISQLDCSLEIFDSNVVNGEHKSQKRESSAEKNKPGNGNHTPNPRGVILKEKSKNEILPNGQFEDMSDVSGFTANYIRSTKINSRTPQKVRNKPSRNLMRESQQKLQKDESKIIVCVNKSVNTGLPDPLLNQSTDSQNVINLVTVNNNNNEKSLAINQSTSQLKFMESKNDQIKESVKDDTPNMNISFQSKSSGVSRYPTRFRNNSKVTAPDLENSLKNSPTVKKKVSRGMRELKSINQNEQPICLISRTRSGKQIGVMEVDLEDSTNSKVNNVVDKVSSSVIKNVASSANRCVEKKKRVTNTRCAPRLKRSDNRKQGLLKDSECDSIKQNIEDSGSSMSPVKCGGTQMGDNKQSTKRESTRDKSGFAACFSDSEEDKPLLRRKFFC